MTARAYIPLARRNLLRRYRLCMSGRHVVARTVQLPIDEASYPRQALVPQWPPPYADARMQSIPRIFGHTQDKLQWVFGTKTIQLLLFHRSSTGV